MGDVDKSENALNIQETIYDFPDRWMIRSCAMYKDEYSECKSIKGRFHQYFIYGETVDCNPWKVDLNNCEKFTENNDSKAYQELLKSEQKRREDRLRPHFKNDVWKKRVGPPPDWNKKLPAWFEEQNKVSYLGIKADEIQSSGKTVEGERTLCVIS